MRDYDKVTAFLGEWEPVQRLLFILLSLSSIPNGYVGVAMVFVADIPPHHCHLPHLNSSYGAPDVNQSIPLEELNGKLILSRCHRYEGLWSGNETSCLDGWDFSKEQYISTIVTEWNLVCDDAWKAPFSATVFFLGVLTGSFISGVLSDKYGRKYVFFGTMAVQTIFTLLQAASTSWEMFCVLYFIVGMGQIANYCTAFILGSEILSKSMRETYAILGVSICYAIGYMCLPLFAYFIRNWRYLLVALSLPGFLYIPMWWYIPESPRWLLSQGRVEEAEAIVRAMAKKNGITAPDVIFRKSDCEQLMGGNDVTKERNPNWFDLFKTANIRNTTILNIIIWMIISMTYYGLSLNVPNMDGDPYINCLIAGATELVSYGLIWLCAKYTSRRFPLPFTLILCGLLLLLIKFVPEDLYVVLLIMAMTGKTAVTGAFVFVYMYASELFPTVVRNMGMSTASMASRIGSALSPLIAYTGTYNKILPYILMGGVTVMTGLLSILLPETKDEELPELISQMKPIICVCRRKQSAIGERCKTDTWPDESGEELAMG